jgi:N-methylhydantoinase B
MSGMSGSVGHLIVDGSSPDEKEVPPADIYHFNAGQRYMVVGSGGGGYGDPLLRDIAVVERDVQLGYVSPGSAEADYGVIIGPDGSVDREKTESRREELRRSEHQVTE